MEEIARFRFFGRNVFLLQLVLFLAVRYAVPFVQVRPLQCATCSVVNRTTAFVLDNSEKPKDVIIQMSHDLDDKECKCPQNAWENSVYHKDYPFMTRFNATFQISGVWSIHVIDSNGKRVDSLSFTVYDRNDALQCYGTEIMVQFGDQNYTSAEEFSSSIPTTSTGHSKTFEAYPIDEEACQDPEVTWQVERFAVDYEDDYCILPIKIKKVDLAAFNAEKTYIPADVINTGMSFILAPFMVPPGFVRIRLFVNFPELDEYYELFSYFKVKHERVESAGHIRWVPEADQICAPPNRRFTIDASRSYSSYLTPESSFIGTPHKHETFIWNCRGSFYVCNRMKQKYVSYRKAQITGQLRLTKNVGVDFTLTLQTRFPNLDNPNIIHRFTSRKKKKVIFTTNFKSGLDIVCLLNCKWKVRPGIPILVRAELGTNAHVSSVEWALTGCTGCTFLQSEFSQYVAISVSPKTAKFKLYLRVIPEENTKMECICIREFDHDNSDVYNKENMTMAQGSVTELFIYQYLDFPSHDEYHRNVLGNGPYIYNFKTDSFNIQNKSLVSHFDVTVARNYMPAIYDLPLPNPKEGDRYILRLRPYTAHGKVGKELDQMYYEIGLEHTETNNTETPTETMAKIRLGQPYDILSLLWITYMIPKASAESNAEEIETFFANYSGVNAVLEDFSEIFYFTMHHIKKKNLTYNEAYLANAIIHNLVKHERPRSNEMVILIVELTNDVTEVLESTLLEDVDIVQQITRNNMDNVCNVLIDHHNKDLKMGLPEAKEMINTIFSFLSKNVEYHFRRAFNQEFTSETKSLNGSCLTHMAWKSSKEKKDLVSIPHFHYLKAVILPKEDLFNELNHSKYHFDIFADILVFHWENILYASLDPSETLDCGTTIIKVRSKFDKTELSLTSISFPIHVVYEIPDAHKERNAHKLSFKVYYNNNGHIIDSTCHMFAVRKHDVDRSLVVRSTIELFWSQIRIDSSRQVLDILDVMPTEIKPIFIEKEMHQDFMLILLRAFGGPVLSHSGEESAATSKNMDVSISLYHFLCAAYDMTDLIWETSHSCVVHKNSSGNSLICACKSLGTVSGMLHPDNKDLGAYKDLRLLTESIYLFVPFITMALWLLFLALIVWAHRKDRLNALAYRTHVPIGAYSPSALHQFLICVGSSSSTTSDIGMNLVGAQGRTPVIYLKGSGLFEVNSESWFLFSTGLNLGTPSGIHVYLQPLGSMTKWYLSSVSVYSLKNDKWYYISCNAWITGAKCRQYFPVSLKKYSITFIEKWIKTYIWYMKTQHFVFGILFSPPGHSVTKVRHVIVFLSFFLASMTVSLFFITGTPINILYGDTLPSIPILTFFLNSLMYSPILLGTHVLLVFGFHWILPSDNDKVFIPVQPLPSPYTQSLIRAEVVEQTKEIPHDDDDLEMHSRRSTSSGFRFSLIPNIAFENRKSHKVREEERDANFSAKEEETEGIVENGHNHLSKGSKRKRISSIRLACNSLVWVGTTVCCCVATYCLLFIGSYYVQTLATRWLASSLLMCALVALVMEPVLVLIYSFFMSMLSTVRHREGKVRAQEIQKEMSYRQTLQDAGFAVPLRHHAISQNAKQGSTSLFYMHSNIEKENIKRKVDPPQFLKERAHFLIIFVILVSLLTHQLSRITVMWQQSEYLKNKFHTGLLNVARDETMTEKDVIHYIEYTLMGGLKSVSRIPVELRYKNDMQKIFGYTARIRQVRNKSNPGKCNLTMNITAVKPRCDVNIDNWEEETRDFPFSWNVHPTHVTNRGQFGKWQIAYIYTPGDSVDFSNYLTTYPSGGYAYNIPLVLDTFFLNQQIRLYNQGWLNNLTKAVMVEMTLVNFDTSIATTLLIAFEYRSGGIFQSSDIYSFPLLRAWSADDTIIIIEKYMLLTFIAYEFMNIMVTFINEGLVRPLTRVLFYFDLFRLLASVGLSVALYFEVELKMEKLKALTEVWRNFVHKDDYINFRGFRLFHSYIYVCSGFLVYILSIQILLKTREIPRLKIFFNMLAVVPVLMLPPILMTWAFSFTGWLLFRTGKYEFSRLTLSYFETCQQMMRPVSRLKSLQQLQPIAGPLFTIGVFMFISVFIYNTFLIFFTESYWYFKTSAKWDEVRRRRKRNLSLGGFLKHNIASRFKRDRQKSNDTEVIENDIAINIGSETWHLLQILNGVKRPNENEIII